MRYGDWIRIHLNQSGQARVNTFLINIHSSQTRALVENIHLFVIVGLSGCELLGCWRL